MQNVEEHVRYFRTPAGSVAEIRETQPGATPLPHGAVEIDAEEYGADLTHMEEARARHVAELQAADRARQKADYAALSTLGLPEETARRLSGLGSADG